MRALIRALAAVSLVSVLAAGAYAGDPRRVQAYLQKGIKALQAGEITKAEEMFLKARKVDPEFPQPEFLLGQIEMARSRYDAAEAHFLKAVDLYIAFGDRMAREQRMIEGRQQLDAMARGVTTQHSRDTSESTSLRNQANAIRLGEKLERAERDKWEPIDDGIPPDLFVLLGNSRIFTGRPAEAAEAYREAARRAPDKPAPMHNLAVALMQAEEFEDALDACRRALGMGYGPSGELCPEIEKKIAAGFAEP